MTARGRVRNAATPEAARTPADFGQPLGGRCDVTTTGQALRCTGPHELLVAAAARGRLLDDHVMRVQIEDDDQRARAVRRRQRLRLPTPGRQPQRGVLQLRLGGRQGNRELSQHLGVRVEGVARRLPPLVRQRRPVR